MNRPWVASLSLVLVSTLACGPNTGGVGDATEDGSGSGSSSGSDTTASTTTTTTMTMTSNGSADGTGTTGTADGSSSVADVTTDPGTSTTTGDTSGSTGGSSSGEPPAESYPGCMVPEDCPEPYDLCWPPPEFGMPNFCTIECVDPGDCPEPTSGTATPVCEGPPGTNICVLDCSMGDCPDGMDCVDIFGNGAFLRCTRP